MKRVIEKFRVFEAREDKEKIDEVGFAKVATIEGIKRNGYMLTLRRYIGIKIEDDEILFEKKMEVYSQNLLKLLEGERELIEKVKEIFNGLGFWSLDDGNTG